MSPPTGLYVHWPYCARICPYCDFNVVRARSVDEEAWAKAFEADLTHLLARFGRRPLVSLYLGGGTPSLMSANLIGRIREAANRLFGLETGAEVTLEANPNDVTEASVAQWQGAGVNRLSLGVQSFDDASLRFVGRDHDARAARRAVDLTLRVFARSSFDLIYALPGQTSDDWETELKGALATGARHLSIYQLTVEPGTAFGRQVARGEWAPPGEGLDADLYELTHDVTTAAGLPPYEVSSHAAAGNEAVHNGLYWTGADWLAIGPGAHGRLTTPQGRVATEGTRNIHAYLDAPSRQRLREEMLDDGAVLTERVSAGLRRVKGIEIATLGPAAPRLLDAARPWAAEGLLEIVDGHLMATRTGRQVLDALLAEIL
ncbi:radical SAM family heme chaperone HemW [Parvularcula dongshanensis]|uniref:Heme chaperone HemW n=1 Tax=Parvularcula dongshanensis TaxID=1173995 RepID=A0A840I6L3_9PROT|nr:oxygen-independent coproporphyrinogen-3 oxidase [Parvularcula dongshanensis]